jgi:hypothetical protein
MMTYLQRVTVSLVFALPVVSLPAWGQTRNSLCDEIAKLNTDAHRYMPPPRWQDDELTPLDQRILQLGTQAIPLLTTCLADERKASVYGELWGEPSVGMVAFSMLQELFMHCQSYDEGPCRLTIKGVITWDDLCKEGPSNVVYPCWAGWENHLKKYGLKSIQGSWQKAWTENKDLIYWDPAAKCFRVKKTP